MSDVVVSPEPPAQEESSEGEKELEGPDAALLQEELDLDLDADADDEGDEGSEDVETIIRYLGALRSTCTSLERAVLLALQVRGIPYARGMAVSMPLVSSLPPSSSLSPCSSSSVKVAQCSLHLPTSQMQFQPQQITRIHKSTASSQPGLQLPSRIVAQSGSIGKPIIVD